MLTGPPPTIQRSRRLRRAMSLPEVLLWRELKQRPGGLKFRRQHPAGPYTADFFCHEARLIVEVDGEAHQRGDRPHRDMRRDAWFEARRFRVLRIAAVEVLSDIEAAILGIVAAADPSLQGERNHAHREGDVLQGLPSVASPGRTPPPLRQASPATSPRGGGLE
ncbi:MAG: endonuclease domain-containing protein [Alphaproteobacteria bacterium]|nr:endonuclease domain-containing protein [Alphaproteobacteria bacterium]MBV9372971.1 endonuclease domain-containing protein [Alphaproteobacteria bacterium]MBV9901338.1 endonuclease domain-containing protein [Alphaproteobacteria bacterium]